MYSRIITRDYGDSSWPETSSAGKEYIKVVWVSHPLYYILKIGGI